MFPQERFAVRPLEAADVHAVVKIIRDSRLEYGLGKRVPVILEPADHDLLETYRYRRAAYFVATVDGIVAGGAGISRLRNGDGSTCELQRMYLQPASRGLGIGTALLRRCLQAAREFAYAQCYAETVIAMTSAIKFYERHGFTRLGTPMGAAGHPHNECWLLLQLNPRGEVADTLL